MNDNNDNRLIADSRKSLAKAEFPQRPNSFGRLPKTEVDQTHPLDFQWPNEGDLDITFPISYSLRLCGKKITTAAECFGAPAHVTAEALRHGAPPETRAPPRLPKNKLINK